MTIRALATRLTPAVAICALLAANTPNAANAADTKGLYAVHGIGTLTCDKLITDIINGDTAARAMANQWLEGYLSALNRISDKTYDIVPVADPVALTALLVNNCKDNPKLLVETMAASMVKLLQQYKLTEDSPWIEAKNAEGGATQVRASTLAALQEKLVKAKLMTGAADGKWGDGTRNALLAYQKANKLPPSGLPDTATTLKILFEAAPGAAPAAPGGH